MRLLTSPSLQMGERRIFFGALDLHCTLLYTQLHSDGVVLRGVVLRHKNGHDEREWNRLRLPVPLLQASLYLVGRHGSFPDCSVAALEPLPVAWAVARL